MINFETTGITFNLRAAGLIQHNQKVLLHKFTGAHFWTLPGGRINAGESSAEAIAREIHEELAETVTVARPTLVTEHFYEYLGRPHHEICFYHPTYLTEESAALLQHGDFPGAEKNENLIFCWFPIEQLRNLDLRPLEILDHLFETENMQHLIIR
ncbi:NUDIX hydrolase [Aquipseudomonas alcaligenes]|uniref:NUDIX hydrolase n=1 Tax=Aquipseudomonas alcaligenes TaxID=43263 RepID=A0A2V4KJN8_AQUAC|nr:NUDIX domain-containing protein [Pseudomonas alcaligenes]PYC20199.1 NUDIX hydrolase [Pseudomonas alcaligenes]